MRIALICSDYPPLRTSAAVQEQAAERLAYGGASVRQLIGFRNAQLANAVSVLSADFGFREADARARPFASKYYTAELHKGAQALPPFVAEALSG